MQIITAEYHAIHGAVLDDYAAKQEHFKRSSVVFETALRLQPQNYMALRRLSDVYAPLQMFRELTLVNARIAELRPNNFSLQARTAMAMVRTGELTRSGRYATRARALLTDDEYAADSFSASWVALFEAHLAWLENDAERALKATDAVAAAIDGVPIAAKTQFVSQIASMYASIGCFDRAEQSLAQLADIKDRILLAGHIHAARDDRERTRQFLSVLDPEDTEARNLLSLFIDAGLLDDARTIIDWHQRQPSVSTDYVLMTNGLLARAEGRADDAIVLLERALKVARGPGKGRAARGLAAALNAKGQMARAIGVLERTSSERREAVLGWSTGYAWISMRGDLAALYRLAGRRADAEVVEAELLKLLRFADAGHRVKAQIMRARAAAPGAPR